MRVLAEQMTQVLQITLTIAIFQSLSALVLLITCFFPLTFGSDSISFVVGAILSIIWAVFAVLGFRACVDENSQGSIDQARLASKLSVYRIGTVVSLALQIGFGVAVPFLTYRTYFVTITAPIYILFQLACWVLACLSLYMVGLKSTPSSEQSVTQSSEPNHHVVGLLAASQIFALYGIVATVFCSVVGRDFLVPFLIALCLFIAHMAFCSWGITGTLRLIPSRHKTFRWATGIITALTTLNSVVFFILLSSGINFSLFRPYSASHGGDYALFFLFFAVPVICVCQFLSLILAIIAAASNPEKPVVPYYELPEVSPVVQEYPQQYPHQTQYEIRPVYLVVN